MNDAGLKKRNPVLAPILMVVNGVSLYAGAALAVGLFESFPPALVAWMRVAAAAVILLVLYRPAVRNFIGQTGFYAAVYGISTLAMNITFYEAIARIPMGTAVAIEFLGPIAVAALGSKTLRDWAALVLAGIGVMIISGAQWSSCLRLQRHCCGLRTSSRETALQAMPPPVEPAWRWDSRGHQCCLCRWRSGGGRVWEQRNLR